MNEREFGKVRMGINEEEKKWRESIALVTHHPQGIDTCVHKCVYETTLFFNMVSLSLLNPKSSLCLHQE